MIERHDYILNKRSGAVKYLPYYCGVYLLVCSTDIAYMYLKLTAHTVIHPVIISTEEHIKEIRCYCFRIFNFFTKV